MLGLEFDAGQWCLGLVFHRENRARPPEISAQTVVRVVEANEWSLLLGPLTLTWTWIRSLEEDCG